MLVTAVGLPAFPAWKVKRTVAVTGRSGKIAMVTPTAVYLTLSAKDGLRPGQRLAACHAGEARDD